MCAAGVYLSKDLMAIAGHALKANITTLAPLVLPVSEQLLFFINLVARKVRILSFSLCRGTVLCPAIAAMDGLHAEQASNMLPTCKQSPEGHETSKRPAKDSGCSRQG